MKINRNSILGAGVILISLLLVLSSGVTIASTDDKNTAETSNKLDFKIGGQRVPCYGSNLHNDPNDNIVWFYSDTPENFNDIADISSNNFLTGGCFIGVFGDDFLWACEHSDVENSNIWEIDKETGAMYKIGDSGVGLNGLAYDPSSGTLYGCGNENLYTIYQPSGDATLVGPFNTGGIMIGIACDENGKLFGVDIETDSLYEIDTGTGDATLIGELGIDLKEDQDIAYDKDNDILYSTGYKGDSNGGGALGTLDLNDGHYTKIGDFPIGNMGCPSQITCLAIPYGIPNEKPTKPKIEGPPSGRYGTEICWTFQSDDPNGDQLKYVIDWGDKSTDETDCYPANEAVEACHIFEKPGKYRIIAYAQECPDGLKSENTMKEVSIPRARTVYYPIFLRLFERFPNTYFLLKTLLGIL